jgi:general secretion pathway protein G
MALRSKPSRGYTLLELLVVIAVIGILVATAIPLYGRYREKARSVLVYTDLKEIQLGIELLATDTEKWPGPNNVGKVADQEVWDLNAGTAGLVATNGGFPNWDGPYMQSVPKDPWGSDYFFDPDYNINGKNFAVVGSFGPNRVGKNLYDSDDIILVLPAQ